MTKKKRKEMGQYHGAHLAKASLFSLDTTRLTKIFSLHQMVRTADAREKIQTKVKAL